MNKQESTICMNKDQLTEAIYSHLLVEFGYGYFEKSLQTVAENLAEDIIRKQSYTEKMGDAAE